MLMILPLIEMAIKYADDADALNKYVKQLCPSLSDEEIEAVADAAGLLAKGVAARLLTKQPDPLPE